MRGMRDTIIVRRNTAATNTASINDEGIIVETNVDTSFKGSFHIGKTGSDEIEPVEIGKYGQIIQGVVRLPLSASVADGDRIVMQSFNDKFNGEYEITNIQYTRTHLRIEIRKSRV
jgi:hypothetical protein